MKFKTSDNKIMDAGQWDGLPMLLSGTHNLKRIFKDKKANELLTRLGNEPASDFMTTDEAKETVKKWAMVNNVLIINGMGSGPVAYAKENNFSATLVIGKEFIKEANSVTTTRPLEDQRYYNHSEY